ncbi:uncharacterized protein N7529_000235 [Penicillium soppii]|uniref:uncharacterized protein n=1 Tax=Penicillium soppii TaxID=69789 RepID=UPI002547F315|nr:uncharacterized protein N7529_000235 [Penicillium soppii]KAJ5881563.1 hypothetical protein N7529_000235 [Penicillium soppii]
MSSTRSVPRLFRKFTAPFVASRTFLIDNLVVTVFKDSSFDGAATAMVRDYFKRWAATAAQQEEGIGPGRPGNVETILVLFVRLIRGDWKEYDPYEEGERFDGQHEAIEGYTMEDVGWMQVSFDAQKFLG